MSRLLYSLVGADPSRQFSPHVFKIIMALGHKGLDFAEVPTPFTAIPAIEDGFSPSVPVLNDNGHLVRDSFDIALYLDKTYPDRPALFGSPEAVALSRMVEGWCQTQIQMAMIRVIVKDIHDILAPADQAYFRESREKRLGKTLEDVAAGAAAELATFQPRLEPLRHVLRHQPFLGGATSHFADYIVFGAFAWAATVSDAVFLQPGDLVTDWFERCLALNGGLTLKRA